MLWGPAALVAVAIALPLLYLSLRALGGGMAALEVLWQPHTLAVLGRTLALAAVVPLACALIAVPLAWLTVRTDLPLRRMWTVLTVLPLVIPSYVVGFLIVAALGPRGLLQQTLAPLGVERLPDIYGFPGAALTLTLLSFPYILLPVRASLQRMDPALDEAARSLGRSRWRTFCTVTLPLLRPSLAAGMLLTALYTLSDFGAVSLLRYETFTWAIFLQYQTAFDRALAATLSVALIALALGLLWMESRTRGRAAYHRVTGGSQRPPAIIRLGAWRWAALAFCALIVALALVLPMSVLGYWALRGLAAGQTVAVLWGALWNSVYVSALAAFAALLAGAPVAVLLVRHRGKLSAFVDKAAHVGFGLPGIVIALALVFFGANIVTPLYQSLGLLVFAYVTLFLAAALGPLQATLREVNPRLEEAARGLGRTPARVFLSVTLPLMRPGILAAGALVFLLTMKELPATLLLSPLGFDTLATSIWSAASEAYFAQAAAPALLLILVSAVPMTILTLRRLKQ